MIYTELTIKAMKLAYKAHHGQTDKCGVPYIFHPFHLAEQMNDEYTVCTALLHDVIEDTVITLEQLSSEFPAEVCEAIRLLTHNKTTDYEEYLMNISKNTIARTVKLADIKHNSDDTRLITSGISDEEALRLKRKYEKALVLLQQKK